MFTILHIIKQKILRKLKVIFLQIASPNIVIGKGVIIDYKSRVDIRNNHLCLGNNVYLRSDPYGYHAGMSFPTTVLLDGNNTICKIGNNCRINGAYIHAKKSIVIGQNTVIAAGVNILDSNGHETYSTNRTIGRDTPEDIVIGDNVWIGLNAIILKGTSIGDNSIISAGSVVSGNYPNNVILKGNPAKIIKAMDIK